MPKGRLVPTARSTRDAFEQSQQDVIRTLSRARRGWGAVVVNPTVLRSLRGSLQSAQTDAARRLAEHVAGVQAAARTRAFNQVIATFREHEGSARILQASPHFQALLRARPEQRATLRTAARQTSAVTRAMNDHFVAAMATGQTTAAAIRSLEPVIEANTWRAERFARTEASYAQNTAIDQSVIVLRRTIGDIRARWTELVDDATWTPLDDRVAADSIALHGQVKQPGGSFVMPEGGPADLVGKLYDAPPNRPNDRAVLVPWRLDWGFPAYEVHDLQKHWLNEEDIERLRNDYKADEFSDLSALLDAAIANVQPITRTAPSPPARAPRTAVPRAERAPRAVRSASDPDAQLRAKPRAVTAARQAELRREILQALEADPANIGDNTLFRSNMRAKLQQLFKDVYGLTTHDLVRGFSPDLIEFMEMPAGTRAFHTIAGTISLPRIAWNAMIGEARAVGFAASESAADLLTTLIHEEFHGVCQAPQRTYRGVGAHLEEGLVESCAREASRRLFGLEPDRRSYQHEVGALREMFAAQYGRKWEENLTRSARQTFASGDPLDSPESFVRVFLRYAGLDVSEEEFTRRIVP